MGIIEDSIFSVYKKALEEGNIEQAEKAVELMSVLRKKVDIEGFIDHTLENSSKTTGTFFDPFPYRHHIHERILVVQNSAILLTDLENKILSLFSQYETWGTNVQVITHSMIKEHLWKDKAVSPNALRITINRLRKKVELNPKVPTVIVSFYKKGYLFIARQVTV